MRNDEIRYSSSDNFRDSLVYMYYIVYLYNTEKERERAKVQQRGCWNIGPDTHTQKKEGGREREKENENFVRIDARLHRLWSRGDRRSYTNAAQKSRGVQLSILVTRYIYWGNSSTSLDYKTIQTPLSLSDTAANPTDLGVPSNRRRTLTCSCHRLLFFWWPLHSSCSSLPRESATRWPQCRSFIPLVRWQDINIYYQNRV